MNIRPCRIFDIGITADHGTLVAVVGLHAQPARFGWMSRYLFPEKQGNIRRSVRGDTGNKISDVAKFLVQYSEYFTQFCLGLNIFLGIASENMSTLEQNFVKYSEYFTKFCNVQYHSLEMCLISDTSIYKFLNFCYSQSQICSKISDKTNIWLWLMVRS